MNRPIALLLALMTWLLFSGCASTPPGERTPVAKIVPEHVFRADPRFTENTAYEFNVPKRGFAWLILKNPRDLGCDISLNGRALKLRNAKPKRVRLRDGSNRLEVHVDGEPSDFVTLRLVAAADAVELESGLSGRENALAPVQASVRVAALGLPVADAEIAVHLVKPKGRLPKRFATVDQAILEPRLDGQISTGKPPVLPSGVFSRRVIKTDGSGTGSVVMPGLSTGKARLVAGLPELNILRVATVVVPDIDLRSPLGSLQLPVNKRRQLPLKLGVHGSSDRDRVVDVTYTVEPRRRRGLTINGPQKVRFDRRKVLPLNPSLVATRLGSYVLRIVATDSQSGQSDTLEIPISVIERDATTIHRLYTPTLRPSGLRLGTGPTRVLFQSRVSGPRNKPEALTVDEVDADGRVVRTAITRLLDNGQGQDEKPDDFLYSGAATLDGSREGERYFRVGSSDPDVQASATSRIFLVTRFPLGIEPADPAQLIGFASGAEQIFSNQVVIFLVPELASDGERITEIAESVNGRIIGVTPSIRQYLVEFEGERTSAAVLEAIRILENQPGVVAAYPNFEMRDASTAPPTEAGSTVIAGCTSPTCQWYIEKIGAEKAWAQASSGMAEPMGLFEISGVAGTAPAGHTELMGKCTAGNGSNPCGAGQHGTWVAGVMAGKGNNTGIAGIAWQGNFHVYQNAGDSADFHDSLADDVPATVRVLNISRYYPSSAIAEFKTVFSSDKLLVAAGGNIVKQSGVCASDGPFYPAKYNQDATIADQILAVGATDISDNRAEWNDVGFDWCSNTASWIDIYAPGKDMFTANTPAGFTPVSGTSLATPVVTGAAAMLWSLHAGWSPGDVHDKLLGRSVTVTSGKRIDAYAMLGVPVLSLSDATPTIESDCSDGVGFTVAGAADPDLDSPIIPWDSTDTLSYAFVTAAGNPVPTVGPFQINATSGQVSVLPASCPLDVSLSPHTLSVRVTDSIGMTDEKTLTVTVNESSSGSTVPSPPVIISFSNPPLGSSEQRRGLDPYIADAGKISFVVNDKFGFADAIVGLVRNDATSACFEPASTNQRLGSGRDMSGSTDHIGLSGFPIKAQFAPTLQPSAGEQVQIGAQIQALTGTQIRIRLFDGSDNQVGLAQSALSLLEGTCNFPGGQRAHATITAATTSPVAYAVFDVPTNNASGGRVFAIDDVSVSVAP